VIVNILLYHLFMDPKGIVPGLVARFAGSWWHINGALTWLEFREVKRNQSRVGAVGRSADCNARCYG